MPTPVLKTSEGYQVTAGDSTDVYPTLRAGLDAALAAIATFEKPLYFRDEKSGDLNGEMRWLAACDVEGAPVRGVRIDAAAIGEMADSLNRNPRAIPINGGPPPPGGFGESAPHGDVHDSSTLANGRAQWGVVVQSDTSSKLYLYCELMPHIARESDVGRLAEGSVCFDWKSVTEDDAPRGVELISHALTNDPAVVTLEPSNSIRQGRRSISFTGSMRSAHRPSLKGHAVKKTLRSHLTDKGTRGPAIDKLAEIAKLLNIDPDAEMTSEQYESPIVKALCDLKVAANVEKITAPAAGAPAETPAAKAAREAAAPAAPVAALATDAPPKSTPVAGLADEPAKDAFISQVIASLVKAGIAKEGDGANEALAAVDAIKAGSESVEPDAGTEGMGRTARVALDVMRTSVAKLEAEVVELRPLAVAQRARDHADFLDSETKRLDITLTATQRTQFLALDRKSITAALSVVHAPKTGDVMGAAGVGSRTGTDAVQTTTFRSLTQKHLAALRTERPDLVAHYAYAEAQKRARAEAPGLDSTESA